MDKKVVLADNQFLTRLGIKALIKSMNGFQLIGEVSSEKELFDCSKDNDPDIIVIDYHQRDAFNLHTIKRLRKDYSFSNILIVSNDTNRYRILGTIEQGITNYVTKNCGEKEIKDAIQATAEKKKFFCSTVLDYIVQNSERSRNDCSPAVLTERELEIVELVAQGLISKNIAKELHLSPHTVNTHRKNILKKLDLNSSSELILYAIENGIIEKPIHNQDFPK
jgi:DNA-binding NarL/FixJ family response regulator